LSIIPELSMMRFRAWLTLIALFAGGVALPARAASPRDGDPWVESHLEELLTLYRHLHTHPELSFKEVETAKRVGEELRKAGCEVTANVGKLGVVGVMKNGTGPTVLVRTDLDALPVTEATGLPYASKVLVTDEEGKSVGVMHACGHDIHMTNLIGTARWLAAHKERWSGTVVFIGQPAEEKIGGAKEMLADGLYERFPKPDFALALHVAHDLEAGKVGYRAGPAMASSTSMDIIVRGKGGHGAMPQNTVDPIVLSAALILDLQTIVSREIKPFDPAVITVGSIHGGTKHNIIPSDVHLQLTLRAFKEEVRDKLIESIRRRAKGLADAHHAPEPSVELSDGTPPTINTPSLVAKVVPLLEKALGTANVEEVEPTMGAEDFGLFNKGGVPIFMFRLGTIPPERVAKAKEKGDSLPSLHSPLYFPDPAPSLRTGVRAMTAAVVGLLPPKGNTAQR
jgi:amidohydrolase